MKLGQDEMRRRVLLGRLGSVADSIWMYVFLSLFFHFQLRISYSSHFISQVIRLSCGYLDHTYHDP